MATKDLVKKKTIALTPEVHADLMRVVANIQAKNGVNTTANDAVRALLDDIAGEGPPCAEYVFRPELVVRGSTGAAPPRG